MATYTSGLREQIANLLFVGSNPTVALRMKPYEVKPYKASVDDLRTPKLKKSGTPQSSSWKYIPDLDLARMENPDHLRVPREELERRGIAIGICPECEARQMIHDHDYICILCRDENKT